MAKLQLNTGDNAPDFDFDTPWVAKERFYEKAGDNASVLIFLRYLGCPVCQMEMAKIKKEIDLFVRKNTRVFVALQSQPEIVAGLSNEKDWPFTIICDPNSDIFSQYHVTLGGILKYLHPAGLVAVVKATFQGFRHGKFEGRETQLPASFIVAPDKRITYAYYGKTICDLPSAEVLAAKV